QSFVVDTGRLLYAAGARAELSGGKKCTTTVVHTWKHQCPASPPKNDYFGLRLLKAMEVSQKPFSRKKPDQLVYLELGSGNGGMLLSVSEDGFRFRAVSPLRPQGLMPFAFSFDGNRRLQGIGEVEWLEDDGKSGGMRFVEVSSDFRSALDQWLALESSRARSSREVTPAAAAPFDTMQKIREELRRGYSQPPARKDSQEACPESPASTREVAYKKSPPESQPQPS